MSDQKEKLDYHFMKAIVICKESGEYLLDLILDSNINPMLLSSFIGALALFGKDNMGKIKEITVKGLDLEMIIVSKYDLILITIMDKDYVRDNIRDEAEKALDMFYLLYKEDLKNSYHTEVFESFKRILGIQIKDYLDEINRLEKNKEIGDFGWFTEVIRKSKDRL
ncbi:MAG: hypothetical protein ACFFDK_01400 [Promethearchaeota archaeon]